MFQSFIPSESKHRLHLCTFFIALFLGAGVYFIASEFITKVEIEAYPSIVLVATGCIGRTIAEYLRD